jgi:hypothetical protein
MDIPYKKIKMNSENDSSPETDHISMDSFEENKRLHWR